MPYTSINGIKINYEIVGKGTPLLMFAPGGFGSTIARWTAAGGKREWKEMDGLATLGTHFKAIAYDRREAGFSGGRIEPLTWLSPSVTRRCVWVCVCTGRWAVTAGC